MRFIDDRENSVVKHDRSLISFQVFKSHMAAIILLYI